MLMILQRGADFLSLRKSHKFDIDMYFYFFSVTMVIHAFSSFSTLLEYYLYVYKHILKTRLFLHH